MAFIEFSNSYIVKNKFYKFLTHASFQNKLQKQYFATNVKSKYFWSKKVFYKKPKKSFQHREDRYSTKKVNKFGVTNLYVHCTMYKLYSTYSTVKYWTFDPV